MSVKIIQERLDRYLCASTLEEENAIKEISQEIALLSLSRAGFFKVAAFQGGTCLRVLFSLDRFSEDLDFALMESNPNFQWKPYLEKVVLEFAFYGYELKVQDRSEAQDPVKKAFLKDHSIGKVLSLKHRNRSGRQQQIQIRLEIDTHPPLRANYELKYLDFPLPYAITVHDLPTLFAGKSHALLTRPYTKGRDWYDFLWYTARKTKVNYLFLFHALEQHGPWKGKKFNVDKEWYLREMESKIKSIDWKDTKADVSRFLKARELQPLEFWSEKFFLERLTKMKEYL